MNKDHRDGTAKDVGGKVKEEAGNLTGDKETKREGQADQAEGKVQKGVGDLKDAARGDK